MERGDFDLFGESLAPASVARFPVKLGARLGAIRAGPKDDGGAFGSISEFVRQFSSDCTSQNSPQLVVMGSAPYLKSISNPHWALRRARPTHTLPGPFKLRLSPTVLYLGGILGLC